MSKINLELELVALEDGSEHDIPFFLDEIKEFFEQFGWKVVWTSADDGRED